jgi:DNA polymerase-1
MPTLYLIDGHAQFFRAYHAIRTGMTSPVTKEPTNMTFGFVGMLLKVLREYKPDYLAVVIDVSGDRDTFRSELYPDYKANREPAPSDFHPQVERCVNLLEQMRVPVLGVAGVEADDVIATLVRRLSSEQPDLAIRIISRDKDLTQLVSERVELWDVHKDERVTAPKLFEVEGVEPRHVRDIIALMGDKVDNVPGVPGIGPKTAAQLMVQYGSIDNLLAHLGEIKGKRRESLEACRGAIPLSRALVTLKDDVPLEFDLESARCAANALPFEAVLATFRELGFNRYQDELRALASGAGGVDPSAITAETTPRRRAARDASPDEHDGLFSHAASRSQPQAASGHRMPGRYECIRSPAQLDGLIARIRAAGECAVDTETDGLVTISANLCGVCLSSRAGDGAYIPTRSPGPRDHMSTAAVIAQLRPLLEDPTIRKIGHHLKFDINVLRRHGVALAGEMFDTMIASYVVEATRPSHKMDHLSLALLGHQCIPITDLIGTGKTQRTFDQAPLDQATEYAAEDADITMRLRDHLAPQLQGAGLRDLFERVEMPLVRVLADMEWNGIRVDAAELDRQRSALNARIDALRRRLVDSAATPFNPDSPRQLAAVLFNRPDQDPPGLGLKIIKRGKTGPSTDSEVLEKLAGDPAIESELPALIVEYRQLTKLVNTYLVALREAIHPATGRVHASFNQTVAATGRLSSSDPNLQNIPIRTDIGREIRRAFVAEAGHVLMTADYSQIELRLLAHLSEDPALIEAFRQGQDIHAAVAAQVYGVKPYQVTGAQRHGAKMVNFGIIYGITAFGLARRLSLSGAPTTTEEAAAIIADYKARFSGIDRFLEQCVSQARTHGYVETILKRRRAIPQVDSRNPQERALGERIAINTVVQGSAADLIKLAMIDIHGRLLEARSCNTADAYNRTLAATRLVLQIHDELVFECPESEDCARLIAAFVVERMQSAMALRVPLVVDAAWSRNWIDAK